MSEKITRSEKRKQQIREELGIVPPKKLRKKRKPMTEEQKAAAIERLAKARAARGITGTKNVHPDVLALPDDHPLAYAKGQRVVEVQSRSTEVYQASEGLERICKAETGVSGSRELCQEFKNLHQR